MSKEEINCNSVTMESELNMALAVSLIQNKPVGMDIVDYVTSIQSKIIEKESDLFFQEFLCDSESKQFDEQSIRGNVSLPYINLQDIEKYCKNSEKKKNIESQISSAVYNCTSNLSQRTNICLIQPIVTMNTLTGNIDSGYNTNDWNINSQHTNLKPIKVMSQSVQEALDLIMHTLFDNSKLLETIINWNDNNNLARYFVDLVTKMANSTEFGFTCRDHVMLFVQNTAFKILDDHHLYSSIHVEYQCNLLAKFCYDKYIRWSIIDLLIKRLKIDIQIVPSSSSLRSIYYTFHFIDKLFHRIDFHTTTETKVNQNLLTDLWKTNQTNKNANATEFMEQISKEWKNLLECISMEAFKKKVFLVSIRANQCLESLKLITSE